MKTGRRDHRQANTLPALPLPALHYIEAEQLAGDACLYEKIIFLRHRPMWALAV